MMELVRYSQGCSRILKLSNPNPFIASSSSSLGYLIARTYSKQQGMYRPNPIVFCGPSGVGKSTLVKQLLQEFPGVFGFSVSHTTRAPRPGEENGREYHFVSRPVMEEAIRNGEFIEYAEFSGNIYGTSQKAVQDVQMKTKICVLDIDTQGVKQIKKTNLGPRYIFVRPPSLDDLKARLLGRGTESEESLQKRLAVAQAEIEYGETPGNFDIIIVNDSVEAAYAKLRKFLLPDITALQEFCVKQKLDSPGGGDTANN